MGLLERLYARCEFVVPSSGSLALTPLHRQVTLNILVLYWISRRNGCSQAESNATTALTENKRGPGDSSGSSKESLATPPAAPILMRSSHTSNVSCTRTPSDLASLTVRPFAATPLEDVEADTSPIGGPSLEQTSDRLVRVPPMAVLWPSWREEHEVQEQALGPAIQEDMV